MLDVAVIIPCYNEEVAIGKVIEQFREATSIDLPYTYKIYVYDNNSTDATAEVVARYQEGFDDLELRSSYMQGKGFTIRRAFGEIQARCYCIIDGDNTYGVEGFKDMCELVLEKKAEMVIGDRLSGAYFTENKRPFHNFGNKLMRWSINKCFDVEYKDILSGLRTFSRPFVKTFPITSGGFALETEMNIHAAVNNMRVVDVPVEYQDRQEGSTSKLQTVPDGLRVLSKLFSMVQLYRPLAFYGLLAVVLFLLGMALFAPVFYEYVVTGEVARFPTLIVSGFMVLAAMLSWFIGLMQNSNRIRHKQLFECDYYKWAEEE